LPLIICDAKRVDLIVDNLIHNSLKYTPAGGTVQVACFPEPAPPPAGETPTGETHNNEPASVLITVHDDGPGIAQEEQERIFQLFYRSPAQQRRHQGMGIGLALARQLAEAHGGTLTVQSEESMGATFTLRLPTVSRDAEAL
jgi:signal transduction histidine kinase